MRRRSLGIAVAAGCLGACAVAAAAGPAGTDPALTLIRADAAWEVTRGDPATRIAIVDTGIDYTHPHLQGRMVDGIDLGEGDDDPMDEIGHGTAVAGVVANVCPRCSLVVVKIFNQQGIGTPYAVLRRLAPLAIRWAVNDGARVINVSDGRPWTTGLLAAVDYARAHGAVVVAAAGNVDDFQAVYPAAYAPVVSVGAADPVTGARYPYSTFGPSLDVTAPGSVVTDWPGARYDTFEGTSAAAPVVSGALGLLFSLHPALTPAQAASLLSATSRDAGIPGTDDDYGSGIVDAAALVTGAAPSRPRAECSFPGHTTGSARPVVFVSSCAGSFDVYSMRRDGGDVRRLTTGSAVDRHPSLSPSGQRIAFLRGDFAQDDLYVMRSDGTGVHRLTRFEGGVESPAWSPNGGLIAFSAYERQGSQSKGSDIYTVRPDGTHLHRITRLGNATGPSWSPDGRKLVFSRVKYADLWLVRADGSSLRRLTRAPRNVGYTNPSWSPDGMRIAFVRRDDSTGDLFVVDADGSHVRRLVTDGDCRSPAWSPDGKRIFFSARLGGSPDLYSIGANGGGPRALLRSPASEVEVGTTMRPARP